MARNGSMRDALVVALPLVLAIVAAFWLAARYVKPAPPDHLRLSTGAETGAYRIFGARYRDVLARFGIGLQLAPSGGSADNLRRLRDPAQDIDIAFHQGGTAAPTRDDTLVALGDLYYEPLWIFYRKDLAPDGVALDRLTQLRGARLAIGGAGSGTQVLVRDLLSRNGIDGDNSTLVEADGLDQVGQLAAGELDAIFTVAPTESALVWTLLYTPGVELMSLAHAEAYSRVMPALSHLVLPAGTIDLAREIPPRPVDLVAARATLLARADTHPALLGLMMQAISEVHSGAGTLQRPGEFPRAADGAFPLAPEAQRYYASGKPWLQRYLPFWAATLVDRLLVMALPLLAVVLPLARIAPALYGWRIKSRIYKRYGELRFLEDEMQSDPAARSADEWREQLDAIEADVAHLRAPLAFTDMMYTLRSHIALVRSRLPGHSTLR